MFSKSKRMTREVNGFTLISPDGDTDVWYGALVGLLVEFRIPRIGSNQAASSCFGKWVWTCDLGADIVSSEDAGHSWYDLADCVQAFRAAAGLVRPSGKI